MQAVFSLVVLCHVLLVLGLAGALEGEVYQNIVLPCSFPPGEDVVIHWTVADNGKQVVHSYYHGKDQLDKQDQSYKGRTSLLLHEIKNGNASLQLLNLQKTDEKIYSCYVGTLNGYTTLNVNLKIQAAVWGEKHKIVIIPCHFTPGEDIVIHWRIANEESRIVHSYYQGKDMLENQDRIYKERTSLFKQELTKGNAALQVRDLQSSDENIYSCYVGTRSGREEHIVKVRVADFNHSIEYMAGSRELPLKCYSSTVYPFDTVSIKWYDNNQIIQEDLNTTSFCRSCALNHTSHLYRCTIQHSIVESIWSGAWEMKEEPIVCKCTSCISVRLYVRQKATEETVASINSTSLYISEGYRNRVHRIPGEFSLSLTNLTMDDNGEYICIIKTVDKTLITLTSVDITDTENPLSHRVIIIIISVLSITAVLIVVFMAFKKLYRTNGNSTQANDEAHSSLRMNERS